MISNSKWTPWRRRARWTAALVAPFLVGTPLCVGLVGTAHADDAATSDIELRKRHYERVEHELLGGDVTDLTPAQTAARRGVIDALREYRERAEFGRATDDRAGRLPLFVDADGRRCAIAHLLDATGRDAFVDRVARDDNRAYVSDLAGVPELGAWLASVGLSLREAARIQAPTVPTTDTDTTVGTGPVTGETTGDGGVLTGGSRGRVGGASRRTPAAAGSVGADSWWLWWEFNKLSYLARGTHARSADARPDDASDDSRDRALGATRAETERDTERRRALPDVVAALRHGDARVRAAAVVALGRMGGPAAVPSLMPLLDDPQQAVREAALLGLGATGAPDASAALLRVAEHGAATRKGGDLTPDARGVALLALGLARRAGLQADIGAEVARIVGDAKKRDAESVGTGAMLYLRLTPTDALAASATSIAADRNAPDAARALAVEGLGSSVRDVPLRDLQRTLAGRDVELRRSAALALGGVGHELVLPRLLTSYELEREPLTRGFLLVAIGEQGGADARAFLGHELRKGPTALRPWAALALGVLARRHEDAAARAILVDADLPAADQGALHLARGLARDASAAAGLSEALGDGAGSPRTRAQAATAMALIGGDDARFALLERRAVEDSRLVRAALAVALGSLGAAEDADFLLDGLSDAADPALRGTLAVALGLHGSVEVQRGLRARLAEGKTPPAERAAVLQALGILLDRAQGMRLPEVSAGTNYAVMPTWVMTALQHGL